MAKAKDEKIPDISTSWEGYAGKRVEEFIKETFRGKYGYIHLRFNDDEKMYYIECYASEDDYRLYESDPETYKDLRLQNERIPITTVKGDAYAATLATTLNTKASIVVASRNLVVPINYRSIKLSEIEGKVNAGYSGTLIIQRNTGSGWTEVGRYPTQLVSQDNENEYEEINIGAYIIDGKQNIRLQAMFEYIENGETKSARSTFLNIGESITYTQLRLELNTDYSLPMYAYNAETGAQKPFTVEYRIFGTCDKIFKYKVYGSVGTYTSSQDSLANEHGSPISIVVNENASSFGFLTHGVRKVEAWLEANDGLGGVIKSEVYTNHFMMVNEKTEGYDVTKKYLLVQNLKTEVTNFIQSTICDYAVYSPDGTDTDINFKLTDAKENAYTDLNRTAKALSTNTLVATIEIEAEDETSIPDSYITRLYAFRDGANFVSESGYMDTDRATISYFDILVDNKNAVTPITGATFKLDPKNRSNEDEDYLNIYGPNGENIAEWTNPDRINAMWTTDKNGIKVLRVMAGSRLVIKRNVWKEFLTNPKANMTLNLDFRVSNVTNTTDPIVSISGGTGGRGLVLNALQGWVKTATYNDPDNCMFAWREDERQYLSLNVESAVKPKMQGIPDVKYEPSREVDSNGILSLARILLNGDPLREIPFDSGEGKTSEWCDDPNAAIIIGNDGADIDIYSLTTYEGRSINLIDLLNRNYLSSIASTEEKMRIKQRNAIFNGQRITLDGAEAAGFNCIIYHGKRPYFGNSSSQKKGWIEYRRYDQDGKYLPEYSGTNCKESNALGWKPQGTTAQTYWDFNQQDDNSKVSSMINVKVEDFHESIHVRIDGDKAYIYGGNLGENFPFEETEKAYAYANGYVTVPDGWIDGNGKYRGMGYQVAPDTPLAQKKVSKINYASSMQSHLIGACTTYDLLHYAVCGATPLQKQYEDAGLQRPVMAKHTEPFLMFWDESEDGNGTPYYTGLCIYGAGKMDKASWGYVKNLHEHFAMVEGADNNMPLTDFRIPFDKNIPYSSDGEGYKYGVKNEDGSVDYFQAFDFDAGKTESFDSPQYDDGWPIVDPIEEEQEDGSQKLVYEAPSKAVRDRFADIHNFIYLNSTNIKYFEGTEAQFLASSAAKTDRTSKYWCTTPFHSDESTPLRLLRFDYLTGEWIDAGLLGANGEYAMVDLKTDSRTASTWMANRTKSNYAEISEAFANDMAKFMKEHIEYFISAQSLRLCYQYVLAFLAGTDNSSKNTYYQIDPIPQTMQRNEAFASWFSTSFGHDFKFDEVYRLYMSGDDMDSIIPLNNKGNLTKPYYIERLFPYADDKPTECLYEGMENQLFNFVENAYTDEDRATFMKTILTKASSLVSESDNLIGLKDKKISTWGFLHKYFFNIQYYFPQVAYIEQARIRYEFAELMGHTGARGVRPISQSIGSQVENEQQFMNQRVVYFASFASFGEFGLKSENTSTGLLDAEAQIAFQAAPLPNGDPATITFTITPHQYMYPCGFYTTGNVRTPRQRTSPKQTCTVNIVSGFTGGDDSMGLLGVNYYTDLGDFGDKSITSAIEISGKRLISFLASYKGEFRAGNITFNTDSIIGLAWSMIKLVHIVDISRLKRVKTVQLTTSGCNEVILPQTHNLETLQIRTKSVIIKNCPKLDVFNLYGANVIRKLVIGDNVGEINFSETAIDIYSQQHSLTVPQLQEISIANIDWTDFPIEALEWYMDRPTCEFFGKIAIKETSSTANAVTWDIKNKILQKFGNVDDATSEDYRGLLVTYTKRALSSITLIGNFYNDGKGEYQFSVIPNSGYANTQTKIHYSISNPQNVDCSMNPITGVLSVNMSALPEMETFVDVIARISRYYEGAYQEDIVVTKSVKVYDRQAELGDLVYADGTFSPVADWDGTKTPIGVCCYIAPRYKSGDKKGDIVEELFNPLDTQQRLMLALEPVSCTSKAGTANDTFAWGAYNNLNAADGIFATVNGSKVPLRTTDGSLTETSFYDIPTIVNLTSSGLTVGPVNNSVNIIEDGNFRDESDTSGFGLLNDGFLPIKAGTGCGDGFAYEETAAELTARTLDSTLEALAGEGYKEGYVVNSGYAKTLKIIAHRNKILTGAPTAEGLTQPLFNEMPIPAAGSGYTELDSLAELLDDIAEWASGTLGDANPNKWKQLYYPASSAAYAYEPTVTLKPNEVLADKFKAHNWFLPTNGINARIRWYLYSEGKNIFAEALDKGLLTLKASEFYWPSTEFYTSTCWYVNFYNGSINGSFKSNVYHVLVVAAF